MYHRNYSGRSAGYVRQAGFTLIEVLVSLAIFATMSVAGWTIFDTLSKIKTRNEVHSQNLVALQSAYSQLLRDMSQVTARPARQANQVLPALLLEQNKLTFTRMGTFDPIQQGSVGLERVVYEYQPNEQRLIRYSYVNPDQIQQQTPPITVLLSKVTEVSITALDPAASDFWPPAPLAAVTAAPAVQQAGDDRLPAGIEFNFKQDGQPLTWRFSLIKKLPSISGLNSGLPGKGDSSLQKDANGNTPNKNGTPNNTTGVDGEN